MGLRRVRVGRMSVCTAYERMYSVCIVLKILGCASGLLRLQRRCVVDTALRRKWWSGVLVKL